MTRYILTVIFILGILGNASSQSWHRQPLVKLTSVWGEVSDHTPEHRGKAGLVLLQLKVDSSFLAYENTDYGASILQVGKWNLKGASITFCVSKTILARPEKEFFMKGRILELENGEITYEIVTLEENSFVIKALGSDKTLKFKQSKYIYFPGDVHL